MKAAQSVLEQEIFVDHRSRGCLKWKMDAEGNKVLQFTDFTKERRPKPVKKKFPNEAAFWRYLERIRTDIDTWKIKDKRERKQKLFYVHREPLGELETFTSEFALNHVLCKEGDGGVQIEQCDIPLAQRARKYILDKGNFWQPMLTVFTSESAFRQALEKQVAQQASNAKWLSVGLVASTIGSTLLQRFSKQASISAPLEGDSKLLPYAMNRAQGEAITSTFLSGLFNTPWSTPAVDVFIPHILPWAITSTLLIEEKSLSQNRRSMLLPFFLVSGATYLPTVAAENVNYLEVLGGTTLSGGGTNPVNYGRAVSATSDGGWIVVGETWAFGAGYNDVLITRVNSSGDPVWARTLGGTGYDQCFAVSATSDGGIALVGYWGPSLLLSKVDGSGNFAWARRLGSSFEVGYAVSATLDGGIVLVGYTDSFGAGRRLDVLLAKLGGSGDLVWTRTLGGSGDDYGHAVLATSDGGYVVVGYTCSSAGPSICDVLLAKVDENGDRVWARTLGGSGEDYGRAVSTTSDGGYVVVGYTSSFGAGDWDVLVAKVDGNANLVWATTFGGSREDYGFAVSATSDGGYVVVGSTKNSGMGTDDVLLAKVDGSGNFVRASTLGGTGNDKRNDNGAAVSATSDGGSVVVGSTGSFGGTQVLLAKVDGSGILPGYSGSKFISLNFTHPSLISSAITPLILSPVMTFLTQSPYFYTIQLPKKTIYFPTSSSSTGTSSSTASPLSSSSSSSTGSSIQSSTSVMGGISSTASSSGTRSSSSSSTARTSSSSTGTNVTPETPGNGKTNILDIDNKILLGAGAGAVLLAGLGIFCCVKQRKKKPASVTAPTNREVVYQPNLFQPTPVQPVNTFTINPQPLVIHVTQEQLQEQMQQCQQGKYHVRMHLGL